MFGDTRKIITSITSKPFDFQIAASEMFHDIFAKYAHLNLPPFQPKI